MEVNQSKKCENCGAPLPQQTDTMWKCAYCGSIVAGQPETKSQPISQAKPNNTGVRPNTQVILPAKKNKNGVYALFIILFVVLAIIIFAAVGNGGRSSSNSYADSVATTDSTKESDTIKGSKAAAKKDKVETDTSNRPALKELSEISIDAADFKILYKNARKKKDQFSNNLEIYDSTSPRYVNENGVYAYIEKDDLSTELRFVTQYMADDWLFISSFTINADGKNFEYSPEFKRDNGQGSIWEWSDMSVPDETLHELAEIANAKAAKIKYIGDKYYNIKSITPKQLTALKKVLQLYKGLLLGYGKQIPAIK